MKTKPSFASLFTLISVSTIMFTTIIIMGLFFINLRSITNRQIEALSKESISRVQENVLSILETREDLIKYSAVGINRLLKTYEGYVPQEVMQKFFVEMIKIVPDVPSLRSSLWQR